MPFLSNILKTSFDKRLRRLLTTHQYADITQKKSFKTLINKAKNTEWGKKYNYKNIETIQQYQQQVPLQSYDDLKPYIDRIIAGEQNILWNSTIKLFAKSSGTTNTKSKLIPISKETLRNCHYKAGKDTVTLYQAQNPNTRIFKGKTLILGGSHKINNLSRKSFYGDLSAILIEKIPKWANLYRTPPVNVALIDEWEEKVEKIIKITLNQNVVVLAGVPSWFLSFINQLLKHTGKKNLLEIWPNLELFIHGGVSFIPYKETYEKLIPSKSFNYLETYNASEGFFGIQNDPSDPSMMLMLDYGIFYEFIKVGELRSSNPQAYTVEDVELNTNYAMVISTSSGLWRYIIGDTIRFTSKHPLKFIITGRTKHFINAFGEELIIDNASNALKEACHKTNATIRDYTAAPVFMQKAEKGRHQWLIEFETPPNNLKTFTDILDKALKNFNSDYEAKRYKNITMGLPEVIVARQNLFYEWLKQQGKLGGQNKVPRLCNDRSLIEELLKFDQKQQAFKANKIVATSL